MAVLRLDDHELAGMATALLRSLTKYERDTPGSVGRAHDGSTVGVQKALFARIQDNSSLYHGVSLLEHVQMLAASNG